MGACKSLHTKGKGVRLDEGFNRECASKDSAEKTEQSSQIDFGFLVVKYAAHHSAFGPFSHQVGLTTT